MSDEGFGVAVVVAFLLGGLVGAVSGWSFRGGHETWKRCEAECAPLPATVRDDVCFCLASGAPPSRGDR